MGTLGKGVAFVGGVVVGAGAAFFLAPVLAPVVSEIGKPLARRLIREGLLAAHAIRVAAAEARESLDDIAAEAAAEIAQKEQGVS